MTGWRCRVCGREVGVDDPTPWRCPAATITDRHHVLTLGEGRSGGGRFDDPNPFVAYHERLAWGRFAAAHGMSTEACVDAVRRVDTAVELVDGRGFRVTPLERSPALSDAVGANVWVKDETSDVAGSHKARHLLTILLQLHIAESLGLAPWSSSTRPTLAISSCGNAAIAAATLAAAVEWPIEVFVPTWAAPSVLRTLRALQATVTTCERQPSDPAGDPCVLRFREAVAAGAVPFTVQGPENALCLDGGRTLGWELIDQAAGEGVTLDRVFVQVGGGAFAGCVGASLLDSSPTTRLHAVQTEGCAPLARAWQLAGGEPSDVATRWSELMWPWDDPRSAADGILDDETYDWLSVFEALERTGGWPVVAPERDVLAAHALVHEATSIDASITGTAGLAGVLAIRDQLSPDDHVAIVLSGITR